MSTTDTLCQLYLASKEACAKIGECAPWIFPIPDCSTSGGTPGTTPVVVGKPPQVKSEFPWGLLLAGGVVLAVGGYFLTRRRGVAGLGRLSPFRGNANLLTSESSHGHAIYDIERVGARAYHLYRTTPKGREQLTDMTRGLQEVKDFAKAHEMHHPTDGFNDEFWVPEQAFGRPSRKPKRRARRSRR